MASEPVCLTTVIYWSLVLHACNAAPRIPTVDKHASGTKCARGLLKEGKPCTGRVDSIMSTREYEGVSLISSSIRILSISDRVKCFARRVGRSSCKRKQNADIVFGTRRTQALENDRISGKHLPCSLSVGRAPQSCGCAREGVSFPPPSLSPSPALITHLAHKPADMPGFVPMIVRPPRISRPALVLGLYCGDWWGCNLTPHDLHGERRN